MSLYDTGEPLASADDFLSLGGVGAGSFSDEQEPPGLDTSGRLLNVYPDPGLDKLTTGEYKESDFNLMLKKQHQTIQHIKDNLDKSITKHNFEIKAVQLGNINQIVRAGAGILAGASLVETAQGGGANIQFYDGTDASTGLYLMGIAVSSGGYSTIWTMPTGITFNNGIYALKQGPGTAKGAIYLIQFRN